MTQKPANPSAVTTPEATQHTTEHAAQIRQSRIDKLDAWQKLGHNPYPYHFEKSHSNAELQAKYEGLENGVETEDVVSVAGRVMALRNSGMFIDLQDPSG